MAGAGTRGGGRMDETLAEETVGVTAPVGPFSSLERGEVIGRYVVLELLGAGGMGVVYAAYDPDLDRKVALKLLRSLPDPTHSRSGGRARLVHEAQAMAKLSHPNVVAIHDVGIHGDQVFLAMEFVKGQTLKAWMTAAPRDGPAMVSVFVAAGQGLAAAHEAGLVHRDFKPDNVLISETEVVKVTDFGIARTHKNGDEARPSRARSLSTVATPSLRDTVGELTSSSDGVAGTPAYMAPEQHLGLPTDARSDQFSFCVALYEALYGQRPFQGESDAELVLAMTRGERVQPPPGSRVPGHIRAAVLRGLSPEPQSRWPTMLALLDELGRDPAAARRRWLVGSGLAGAVVVLAFALQQVSAAQEARCDDMARHLEGVWDDPTRARVEQAVLATEAAYAQSTSLRVKQGLDAYAAAWVSQRQEACEATQIRGEQSQALMDLRMECLDERLRAVRALVDVLGEADEVVVSNAASAVDGLPRLERCADADALRSEHPLPEDPETLARIEEVRERLARASAHNASGRYAEGLQIAAPLVDEARELGYPPLLCQALRVRGGLESETGDDAAAEKTLREAFFVAVRNRLDYDAAYAAASLSNVVGFSLARTADARIWAEHGRAHAAASGEALAEASVLHNLGSVALQEGKLDEAVELLQSALEIRERVLGNESTSVAGSLTMLGLAVSAKGEHDRARELLGRGLQIAEVVLGEDHPQLASPLNNLAKVAWTAGVYDEARTHFERALALLEAAHGSEHRDIAQLHNNLAAVAFATGDHDEAQRRFEKAKVIWEKSFGDRHPAVADATNNLAAVAGARGDHALAVEYDRKALAIREATMDADHPAIAQNHCNLGEDLRNLGQLDEALEHATKALAIWEKRRDPQHEDIAVGSTALGHVLLDMGRKTEALAHLERAYAIRKDRPIDPSELALTEFLLGRALWDVPATRGRDPDRARALVLSARDTYAQADPPPEELAEVERWLSEHPSG